MDKYLDDNERIEAYLESSMNNADKFSFEIRLAQEPALAKQLAQRRLIQNSWVHANEHDHLKKRIQNVILNEKRTTASYRKVLLIAASFILLAAVGTVLVLTADKKTPNPGIANKTDQVNQSDKSIVPDENQMDEFAAIDSVASTINYSPNNNDTFLESDSIRFQMPLTEGKVQLKIYSFPGKYLAKEVTIPTGSKEYYLMPFSLKKGKYYWTISGHDAQYSFTVK